MDDTACMNPLRDHNGWMNADDDLGIWIRTDRYNNHATTHPLLEVSV